MSKIELAQDKNRCKRRQIRRTCRSMGTTVWSRYCLVGTLACGRGAWAAGFSGGGAAGVEAAGVVVVVVVAAACSPFVAGASDYKMNSEIVFFFFENQLFLLRNQFIVFLYWSTDRD